MVYVYPSIKWHNLVVVKDLKGRKKTKNQSCWMLKHVMCLSKGESNEGLSKYSGKLR